MMIIFEDDPQYNSNINFDIFNNVQSNLPTLTPTIAGSIPSNETTCALSECHLIDVFQDWKKIILGLFFAAFITFPAISVYFRHNLQQRPTKSYFYSCVVKYIGCFFSTSVLICGIMDNIIINNKNCKFQLSSIPFIAAVLNETIEFIFDFGRLVLCFGDPGKLDFYQNARWNSNVTSSRLKLFAVSLSIIPMAIVMFIMWIFVLLSHFIGDGIFSGGSDEDDVNYFFLYISKSTGTTATWLILFAVFMMLSFSFVGGYYLLRMICPCGKNDGEEKGIGYHWGQFKLIAVDIPSLISTGLVNPSSLVFFWTAEFINDMFPFVAGLFIEKLLLEDDDDDDNELHKAKIAYQNEDNYLVEFIPFEYFSSVKEANDFPLLLQNKMDESTWEEFHERIHSIIHLIVNLKRPAPDRCIKMAFIILGFLLSTLYWSISLIIFNNIAEQSSVVDSKISYMILAVCTAFGLFMCVKICFGRDIVEEKELIESLEQICAEYSESNANFELRIAIEDSITKWFCRGGLSCSQSIDSFKGITLMILVDIDT